MYVRDSFDRACRTHAKWEQLPKEDKEAIVRRMERDCFEKTINSCIRDGIDRRWEEKRFRDRYSMECCRILSNLDVYSSVSSSYLLDSILAKNVDPATIAELSNYDLCPEASQTERDEIDVRRNIKVDIKVSHAYKCGKCGKSETTIREYQGRAADEASSLSIKCIHCHHVWRKN